MLSFDFLEGAVPLTKVFRRTDAGLEVAPYPMVRHVTSHRETAASLADLYTLLIERARKNHCLLKGLLRRPIVNQSRAGLTQSDAPTSWLLLDLDFDSGWSSVREFLDDLDPVFKGCSFIFQHSASAGIKNAPGLRGHVFVRLTQPATPAHLKDWLKACNLTNRTLIGHLKLAANGQSVRWPLDITTCQNDKLIYIAPPVCEGFEDPLKDRRFELVTGDREAIEPPQLRKSPAEITALLERRIADLRHEAGLPAKKARYRTIQDVTILQNPDQATVTGVKAARGFVYLNLNGGDSWGYYFPENNPELLYNFKGEPVVRLQDIAPEFYREYLDLQRELKAEQAPQAQHADRDVRPFVFRDPKRDYYYNALYSPSEDRLLLLAKAATKSRLADFMRQYGEEPPEIVEDWELVFDPTTIRVVDFERRWLNRFEATPYMRDGAEPCTELPPVTAKIVKSVCGDDAEAIDHFLNWLAFLFQKRVKPLTAWIFHGTSGTGKGLLVSRILRPLFGNQHVIEITTQNFEDQFNGPLEHALIVWLDEFQVESARQGDMVMNRLKNLITEPRIAVRAMRQEFYNAPSYCGVIVATNHPDPVAIDPNDRRFNVAPAQENRIVLTDMEIAAIEGELPRVAGFFAQYQVDEERVRRVLYNQARTNMIVASQTTVDRFFTAARTGDLKWFLDFTEANLPLNDTVFYARFEEVLARWCADFLAETPSKVTRGELIDVYRYVIGTPATPAKFTRQCNLHRVPESRFEVAGKIVRGTYITWFGNPDDARRFLASRAEPKLRLVNQGNN